MTTETAPSLVDVIIFVHMHLVFLFRTLFCCFLIFGHPYSLLFLRLPAFSPHLCCDRGPFFSFHHQNELILPFLPSSLTHFLLLSIPLPWTPLRLVGAAAIDPRAVGPMLRQCLQGRVGARALRSVLGFLDVFGEKRGEGDKRL